MSSESNKLSKLLTIVDRIVPRNLSIFQQTSNAKIAAIFFYFLTEICLVEIFQSPYDSK